MLIAATFLVSPYVWDYDMVALLFAAALLARDGVSRGGLSLAERLIALLLLALPAAMILADMALLVQIGPAALWLAVAVLLRGGVALPIAGPLPDLSQRRLPSAPAGC